ncbi:FAD binding domain-containing protein [Humitalea sp. 24SJ18S-53]|uniref:FAD binding domain-containing protein n=1 Tax=Humitalea sp. 24SJ18S-53 TaxID=3422307 RepID=UPI003D669E49
MTPNRFDYARPATLAEALALLARHGEDAAPLAGGQSLMPMLALRVARPALLLDLNRLPGLDGIERHGELLRIGAMARHAAVLAHPLVAAQAPLLPLALRHVAHPAIRNRGTLGGSLCLADPAAELPACMLALDAVLVLASAAGERRVAAPDFFQGLYATARRAEEMLLRVEIPIAAGWTPWFAEISRRHGDFAMAGLAMMRRPGAARLAFFGVEAHPRRLPALEAAVAAGADAAALLPALLDPLASPEASAAYRLHLAQGLLRRAAKEIAPHAAA